MYNILKDKDIEILSNGILEELDAFVVLLYFVQLHLESASFTRQLLLLSLCKVDIPGPCVNSRLDSDAFLSEGLLAIVGHIHSGLGTTPSHGGSRVIHHLTHPDFQLLLLCSKLVQLFNQHHVFFEDSSILLSMLGSFLRQLSLQSSNIVLNLVPLLVVNLIDISSARVFDSLIENPSPVETHNSFFELLVT